VWWKFINELSWKSSDKMIELPHWAKAKNGHANSSDADTSVIERRASSIEHRASSIEHRASASSIERQHRASSFSIERRASSIERRASSIERRASSIERRASSIERRASSIERQHRASIKCSEPVEVNIADKYGANQKLDYVATTE
jgi:hypothetical protein